jgi:hypothetical protein
VVVVDPIILLDVPQDVWIGCQQDDLVVHVILRFPATALSNHTMENLKFYRFQSVSPSCYPRTPEES